MNLLKYILAGAAVGFGVNYITKKGSNGRSIIEDLADNLPNWFDEGKKVAVETINAMNNSVKSKTGL
ncbi:YtxH domain-containing protein [uncultured Mucilaginibacter sp.]|uniref:YtxH domain-containing protein n=1 Tax=uncultured Mucilaginibacter sp. TaxID=797541 RepID=UPI0025F0B625|nr:YtxH domain-containing protein [uncultured Mucilaginibacter sp.]